MNRIPVPVIMHHSIGIPNTNWQWNHLTCPFNFFEDQLKWMKKKDYNSITLQQLFDYMSEGRDIPSNPIVLTFDDGFLDNWVFAYPLLKKYGFKGTIYVNPEFVDSRNIVRKNLEDVWKGTVRLDELETVGYLSWDEMRKMEAEGIIDIQSHTMAHTWYPASSKIVDFRHPGDLYIWMTWNHNPNQKPYLQVDDSKLVSYGEPVYESGRAIGIKRYFPDENLSEHMVDYVKENGGKDLFLTANWREKLLEVVAGYREENQTNERLETEEEYEKRIYWELQESRKIIENKLDKEVKFLCWPGGAVTGKALETAAKVGYSSSTVGKDIGSNRKYLRNIYGEDPTRINRIGTILYWDGIEEAGSTVKYKNGFYYTLSLYHFQKRGVIAFSSRMILTGALVWNRIFRKFL